MRVAKHILVGTVCLFASSAWAKKCDLIEFVKNNRSTFQGSGERHTFENGTSMENPFYEGQRTPDHLKLRGF